MSRPRSPHPTDGELEILRVLWEHGPAPLGVVCDALRAEREVATTTVATMLKVMLDKQLVKRTSAGRGYQWSAAVSHESTADSLLGKLVDGLFDGSAERLVAHLVESKQLKPSELAELKQLIGGKRTTSKKGR
ncbi:Penicillinase repressor [Posidoniimonas polymericola]|uniref:Penicillinase repressor n=1 Tax=Posidoniimonas polymericola TaxID=2528002 RepID=A0A5C5YSD5_9BACT|nr:BlaI/MecI/CopY family transcriptional regulator [Posidoniimonas polymericola]TWT77818.1 Penicillinase repressor [Posidoniimonas polymericola]